MKQYLRQILLFLLGIAIIIALVTFVGFEQIISSIKSVNIVFFTIAVVLQILLFFVRGGRWKFNLKVLERDLCISKSTSLIMVGWVANSFLPARLGDVTRAYALRQLERIPLSQGLASIVLERIFDICVIFLMAISFLVFFLGRIIVPNWIFAIFIFVLGVLSIGAIALVFFLRSESLIEWIFSKLFKNRFNIQNFTYTFRNNLKVLLKNRSVNIVNALWTIGLWLLEIFRCYLVVFSLGIQTEYFLVAAALMLAYAIAIIPITPGNIGSEEALMTIFFALILGISLPLSTSIALIDRLITFWISLIVCLIVSVAIGTFSFTFSVKEEIINDNDMDHESIV
ncbi:MAG: lysylphosphatidylglycerol synthase transmembrane domain-containing protein [Promethearchaeota archaeon]